MSTPYPEVKADESGLVPAHPTLRSEWPKKLRALTQQDLDRLTIDQDGRFYWDGKLVTASTTLSGQSASAENSEKALEMLDRAAIEIAGRKPGPETPPAPAKPAPDIKPSAASSVSEPTKPVEAPKVEAPKVEAPKVVEASKSSAKAVRTERVQLRTSPRTSVEGRIRLSLSALQSLGGFLVSLALLVGAVGLTATGWAAAHEWTCRLGMIAGKYCPADMAPKPPMRVNDIPT
jgi:hypothetical protein